MPAPIRRLFMGKRYLKIITMECLMHRRMPTLLFFVFLLLASVYPAVGDIVINEIMYNSAGVDTEYVELVNTGSSPVVLSGWQIKDDDDAHLFVIPSGTVLDPGGYLVFTQDTTALKSKYGDIPVMGNLTFNFGNAGDEVRVFNSLFVLQDIVAYGDDIPWPPEADGNGPSLELYNPSLDNSLPTSWAPSENGYPQGTPGGRNSIYLEDQPPVIEDVSRDIDFPASTEVVTITARVTDDRGLNTVMLHLNDGGGFVAQPMVDDGLHGDGAPADSVFGSVIGPRPPGTLVRYYVSAADVFWQLAIDPPGAPVEYYAYTVDYSPPELRINELLAVNQTGATDEMGELEDWFEIRNAGDSAVDLGGMFLSDDPLQTRMWRLPSTVLDAGQFLLIWADNEEGDGPLHVNFKLDGDGESVTLYETVDHGNAAVHGVTFGLQSADVSFGYYPDAGNAPEYLSTPTPGASNDTATLLSMICINEFLSTSAGGGTDDWVELHNRGAASVDISGWFVTDDAADPHKYQFPPGTILNAGAFMFVTELALGFGFSSTGDEVIMLTAADGLTGQDYYDFGPQSPDITEGRYPDGEAYWHLLANPTPGLPNDAPLAIDASREAPVPPLALASRPNPFHRTTRIDFALPTEAQVTVSIYDVAGRLVRMLHHGVMRPGRHATIWDGKDDRGNLVGSGRYFATIRTPDSRSTMPIVRVR